MRCAFPGSPLRTSQSVCLLFVSFLLTCAMTGCGENPEPVVQEPKAAIEKPDAVAKKDIREKSSESSEAKPSGTPPLAEAPFGAEQASAHQEAWAKHLGVEVAYTNSIGMKLALIPPGEFMMGWPESDNWEGSCNKPEHKVRIMKPSYLAVHEVTQAEYEKVMGENPSWFSKGGRGAECVSGENTSGHPVEYVSWEDAVEFCKRLSAKEGKTYRLPTEAEWEYACRAGTTTQYSFGDDPASLGEYAWYAYNSGRKTHPVGEKKANAWGLHDMYGNVYEWCSDWWAEDYYAASPANDPLGPERGAFRVLRGCSWYHRTPGSFRSAARRSFRPAGDRRLDNGFRVAAVLSSAELAKADGPESKTPAMPAIPPEQVEVVADTAQVKLRDEVIATVGKGGKFAVVRRGGSWVAIDVGTGNNERIGWVWARQVQTVVPPEITEESTAPGSPRFVQVSVDSTQVARQPFTNTSVHLLYCHVSIDNRDANAVGYDATEFELEVDGQAVKHDASDSQRFAEHVRYQDKDSVRLRRTAELEYLQAGQIAAGGQAAGWLRFNLPAFERTDELAKKTWTLSGNVGDRPYNIDLRQAELDALAAKVRPAAVDDSVSVVEIGGSRLNGLNVGRLLELIKPLVAEGQGFVVVLTDEHCIADSLVWSRISSATFQSRDMVAWANIPAHLQSYMDVLVRPPRSFFSSEAEAVIEVIGRRQGVGARLAKHLTHDESATRVAAARAMAEHTAEAGVVEALVKAASHTDGRTRVAAMSSLANSADGKATQAVIKGMSDSEASVRVAAAQAAGSQEAQTVVDPLVGLLDDSDADVVIAASASLGTLKSQEAVPRIRELQASEDQRISAAATDALKAIGALSSLEAARAKLGTGRLSTDELDALAEAKDKTVVPKLIAEMQSNQKADLSFSDRLAKARGDARDSSADRRLMAEVTSRQKADRSYINQLVKVLGDIGDSRAAEPLLELLHDCPGIYEELPMALGKLGDNRAIKPLEEALDSGRIPQRCSCYGALLMLEAPGILDRISADVGKNPNNYRTDNVKQLLEILARRRDPQVIPLIEALLDSSQHHRSAALALFEVGTPAAIEVVKSRLLTPDYPHSGGVMSQVAVAAKLANQEAFTAQPATSPQFGDQLQRAASFASFLRDMKNSPNLLCSRLRLALCQRDCCRHSTGPGRTGRC